MEATHDSDASLGARALEEQEALPLTGTVPVGPLDASKPVAVPGKIVFHRPLELSDVPTTVAVAGRIVFHQRTHAMRRGLGRGPQTST